ncbi:hypothetical protein SEEE5646_11930, partial [Salmonella enterica subsp. enterica serovar Enteritidis str. 50-5646]
SWAASSGFSRILVGGYFAGETGLHRSLLTARATQAMAKRQKLRSQYSELSMLPGTHSLATFKQLELFWVYISELLFLSVFIFQFIYY